MGTDLGLRRTYLPAIAVSPPAMAAESENRPAVRALQLDAVHGALRLPLDEIKDLQVRS